jgi:hypothetical protein
VSLAPPVFGGGAGGAALSIYCAPAPPAPLGFFGGAPPQPAQKPQNSAILRVLAPPVPPAPPTNSIQVSASAPVTPATAQARGQRIGRSYALALPGSRTALGEATLADLELARHEIERQTLELSGWSIWLERIARPRPPRTRREPCAENATPRPGTLPPGAGRRDFASGTLRESRAPQIRGNGHGQLLRCSRWFGNAEYSVRQFT